MAKRKIGTWHKDGRCGDAVQFSDGHLTCFDGGDGYDSADAARLDGVAIVWDDDKPAPPERLVAVEVPAIDVVNSAIEAIGIGEVDYDHCMTIIHTYQALVREKVALLNLPSEHANADAMQRIDEKLVIELRSYYAECERLRGLLREIRELATGKEQPE